MNKVKRTARKRHIRQSINRAKLEGREPMKNGGKQVQRDAEGNAYGFFITKDNQFAAEVAATLVPYTIRPKQPQV